MKSIFYEQKTKNEGLNPQCIFSRKKYYTENPDRIKDYYLDNWDRTKEYQLRNHDKNNARKKTYSNDRYKTDINFRLIQKTRSRIFEVLQRISKSTLSKENLGTDIDSYRRGIEYHMTPNLNWTNIEIDHVKPLCMFDVSKDKALGRPFCWKKNSAVS